MPSPPGPPEGAGGAMPKVLGAEIDHVGVAVHDVDRAVSLYRDGFGCSVGPVQRMPDQGIAVAFVEAGPVRLELIAPIGEVSPIRNLLGRHTIQDALARRPSGGLHHVCYRVADLGAALAQARAAGVRPLGKGVPVTGASGHPIVFLDPKDAGGVLIELKGPAGAAPP